MMKRLHGRLPQARCLPGVHLRLGTLEFIGEISSMGVGGLSILNGFGRSREG